MLQQSTPFKQFRLVFKLYGYIPSEISSIHKIVAVVFFVQLEIVLLLLMMASLFQKQKNSSTYLTQACQSSYLISFALRSCYFFWKFHEIDGFMYKLSQLFAARGKNERFDNALKSLTSLAIPYCGCYAFITIFAPIGSMITKSTIGITWKPTGIDPEVFFYFDWFQQAFGSGYFSGLFSIMDLFPFCIMVMFREYLISLNLKVKNVITVKDLIERMEELNEAKKNIAEFQRIFSPILFVQSSAMVGTICATLLIITTNVRIYQKIVRSYCIFTFCKGFY